jgi:hypothetical protein
MPRGRCQLTNDDLKEIGIKLGDRNRILGVRRDKNRRDKGKDHAAAAAAVASDKWLSDWEIHDFQRSDAALASGRAKYLGERAVFIVLHGHFD